MKHNLTLRRGLCVLLSLLMCLSLLPAAVLADEPATVTADFTADADAALALLNAAKTGEANSIWENNTLTLNGVNFTTTAETAVILPAGAKIVLAEGTTNTIASSADNADMSYGIYAADGLTIEGSGTLIVRSAKATTTTDSNSYGIYADDGDITITGGTVIAASGTANAYSYGICLSGENTITISGGAVNATGGKSYAFSGGIGAGNVIISDGTVTAKGGQSSGESRGISGGTKAAL